eukprot:Platyproteum_vivax@DN12653_c0_g1_i1.p1
MSNEQPVRQLSNNVKKLKFMLQNEEKKERKILIKEREENIKEMEWHIAGRGEGEDSVEGKSDAIARHQIQHLVARRSYKGFNVPIEAFQNKALSLIEKMNQDEEEDRQIARLADSYLQSSNKRHKNM